MFTKRQVMVGNRRLRRLAEFIRGVPPEHFDMTTVIYNDGEFNNGIEKRLRKLSRSPDPPCGTSACAIGWCPIVFPKLFRYYGPISGGLTVDSTNSLHCDVFSVTIEPFAISWNDAHELFRMRNDNKTPKQVARNIEKFVKKREKSLPNGIDTKSLFADVGALAT